MEETSDLVSLGVVGRPLHSGEKGVPITAGHVAGTHTCITSLHPHSHSVEKDQFHFTDEETVASCLTAQSAEEQGLNFTWV
jgi:hypothetical protein